MPQKTQLEMLRELYQVIIGLPNNPKDNGLIGKIDGIESHLKSLNGAVSRNTIFRKATVAIGIPVIAGIVFLVVQNLIA